MVLIAVLAFGLGSLAMIAAPLLAEKGVAMVQKQRAAATSDATEQQSLVATAAVAAAQEASSLPQ
jgi:hypothetical protein